MKKMNKALAAVLSCALATAMTVPAFAVNVEGQTGSITIENAAANQTYNAYRILDLISYTDDGKAVYKLNPAFKSFIGVEDTYTPEAGGAAGEEAEANPDRTYIDVEPGANYLTFMYNGNTYNFNDGYPTGLADISMFDSIITNGNVTLREDADIAAMGTAYITYAKANGIAAVTAEATGDTVTMSDVPYGYYAVDTTSGSLISVGNSIAVIQDKNSQSTLELTSSANKISDGVYSAQFNDPYTYTVTIDSLAGAQKFEVSANMAAGITYNGIESVKVVKANGDEVVLAATDYAVVTNPTNTGFTLTLQGDPISGYAADDKIEIAVGAELNDSAVLGGEGNAFTVGMSYGAGPAIEVTPLVATTFAYTLSVDNTDGTAPLTGGEFQIMGANGAVSVAPIAANTYRVVPADAANATTTIVADASGAFTVQGLGGIAYDVVQTKAPDGYNQAAPGAATMNAGDASVTIVNNAGAILPSTGGIGTTIFYIIGGALIAIAAVALIVKRRMAAKRG